MVLVYNHHPTVGVWSLYFTLDHPLTATCFYAIIIVTLNDLEVKMDVCYHYNICLDGTMWFTGGDLHDNYQWVCQDCGHALSSEELRDREAMFNSEEEENEPVSF